MRAAPSGAIASLRHVSASGHVDSWWQFIPAAGLSGDRITARLTMGSAAPVELEIPVCTSRKPKPGAWVVLRVGETTWRVTAARYPTSSMWQHEMTEARAFDFERFEAWLPVGSIDLVDAPPKVQRELESIE